MENYRIFNISHLSVFIGHNINKINIGLSVSDRILIYQRIPKHKPLNAFNKCACFYVYYINYDGQPDVHYNINKTKE